MAQTTGAAPDYPVPTTPEEKQALLRALATATRRELEPVLAFLDDPATQAVIAKVEELKASVLPAGSGTKSNVDMLATFFPAMRRAVEHEIKAASDVIDPPAPPPPPIPAGLPAAEIEAAQKAAAGS